MWLTLPKAERWTKPSFRTIRGDGVPIRRDPGVEGRIYSCASGTLRSTTQNYVPLIMVEIGMEPQTSL